MSRAARLATLSRLCLSNARALCDAVSYCGLHGIGCFRVNSRILPLKTHPETGYEIDRLPDAAAIREEFDRCRRDAAAGSVRLTFHPDQFVVLNSLRQDVVRSSIAELEYQAQVSALIGADVITLHAGGSYGDKEAALKRLKRVVARLPRDIRVRLALENDDRVYSPADLLPLCLDQGIPFVYDVHHHRCLPDGLSVEEVTRRALQTWDREPLFHLSSPRDGWGKKSSCWHGDYINVRDFPREWEGLDITVEIEAKAKELAVEKLSRDLSRRQ